MTDYSKQIALIAYHLGKPWKMNHTLEPSDWRFEIIDGCGRKIFFRLEKDKFRISGCGAAQKTGRHHPRCASIGVSAERPAKAIAADIKRRFLPDYLAAFETAVTAYQKQQAEEQKEKLIREAVIKVSGGYYVTHARRVYFEGGTAEISAYRDNVTLTLNDLSPDIAIQIIGKIKQVQEEA